ncbi:uncharacterized protein [Palaemon carinicauda]|uniref:uncharacterized protein isoform X2 n=1 Tax=Palaemon carinicauda TaxID=392227 RepID=UPI0035B5BCDC
MSTVVNGHREDDNTPHSRPHGHILPMLSFSASTPTDEDNPLDSNPVIAIDMPLWEQQEDAVAPSIQISNQDDLDDDAQGGRNAETVPLIDVARDVILIDGPDGEDDDEPDENAPLLAGGSRGGGGGGIGMGSGLGGCSDDADRSLGGLGIPLNMPRRSSSHIGIAMENGEIDADMESSIASFLRSKSESENLASSAATNSPDGDEAKDDLKSSAQKSSVSELRDVASQLVSEVLNQAQAKASNSNNLEGKVEENEQRIEDPHSDERLMEIVHRFVSDIMSAAKAEAWDSMRQIQNNNNNVVSLKGEEKPWPADPHSDEELMDKVRHFVSEILAAAKAEAWDRMRQTQSTNCHFASPVKVEDKQSVVEPHTDEQLKDQARFVSEIVATAKETQETQRQEQIANNNVVLPLKEEAALAATAADGDGVKRGPQNLASPASNHAERLFRGGPWYAQMGRVFSAIVSRICPCRCPTKP